MVCWKSPLVLLKGNTYAYSHVPSVLRRSWRSVPSEGKYIRLFEDVHPRTSLLTYICRYSTTWLARAVPEDGTVTTLDVNPHCVKVATENLTTAGLIHKVNIILGPAEETIQTLSTTPTPFDLVFIDANKEEHATYFKHAKRLLRKGGVMVCDFLKDWCHVGGP